MEFSIEHCVVGEKFEGGSWRYVGGLEGGSWRYVGGHVIYIEKEE